MRHLRSSGMPLQMTKIRLSFIFHTGVRSRRKQDMTSLANCMKVIAATHDLGSQRNIRDSNSLLRILDTCVSQRHNDRVGDHDRIL